uniref:Putative secreted protein n=4 Tax=Anopheles marajoara TaxID=58244 RepID=A0A2M4C7Z3_9DIPT
MRVAFEWCPIWQSLLAAPGCCRFHLLHYPTYIHTNIHTHESHQYGHVVHVYGREPYAHHHARIRISSLEGLFSSVRWNGTFEWRFAGKTRTHNPHTHTHTHINRKSR